uniref:Ionotropic glutamate receptor C-terminal domain-containing protein n=1 Tax=Stomoxys calcitrans TaxID=35570 RepID=A0A1I8Q0I6_STOCA
MEFLVILPMLMLMVAMHTTGVVCGLIAIINNLNEHLNIEWNLIVVKSPADDQQAILRGVYKPKIIVTKLCEINAEAAAPYVRTELIYENHSHNLLAIVWVNESMEMQQKVPSDFSKVNSVANFEYMAHMTNTHLRKLHFVHILWLVHGVRLDYLKDYAEICWRLGFTRTLFYGHSSLYVYNRFPHMQVEKLDSLRQYYAREEIHNFHQHPLKFPITASPPRCYRFAGRDNQTVYAGYMYQIIMTFIRHFNFSFIEYPHDYHKDSKTSLIKALVAGDMDFAAFLTYPKRSFDTSDVLWNGHVYIAVPNASPIPKYQYFEKPFDFYIWLLYGLVILAASLDVAGMKYMKYRVWDLCQSFMYIWSMALYQYQLPPPIQSWRFNLLSICLFVYNFIMMNFYLCILSSMLVSTVYEHQINTIEDLAFTQLRFNITKTDMEYYRESPGISPIILRLFLLDDGIALDNLKRNLSTNIIHGAFEDKLRFFMFQQRYLKVPRLHRIDAIIYSAPTYFAARHNLPYIELFNRYLGNLWASGILWKTFVGMEWLGILSGEIRYFRDEEIYEPLLTLEYFYSPMAVYFGGMVLSILVFALEILHFRYQQKM